MKTTGRVAALVLLPAVAVGQYFFWTGPAVGRLYIIPVLVAALLWGWRAGAFSTAVSVLLILGAVRSDDEWGNAAADAAAVAAAGAIAVAYAWHTQREQTRLREIAAKLSEGYSNLQINFEAMKRAERLSAIGHLSAGLAHEIRNPLASIAGAASILRRTESNDSKVQRCIEIIESECRRLNGLLTNFLNFARPRSPHFQKTDVNKLLAEVMELAEHAVNRRQIVLRTDAEPGLTGIECDPEQLRQVLLNLLINAIDASADGSAITLSARLEESCMAICVVDEGSGVTPEDIDKLFDPFFTTKETGTGLGLPVAHQIIGHMGGSLSARRNAGRGMTFSVILPLERHGVV
jgi:signal transduction histidine kinase